MTQERPEWYDAFIKRAEATVTGPKPLHFETLAMEAFDTCSNESPTINPVHPSNLECKLDANTMIAEMRKLAQEMDEARARLRASLVDMARTKMLNVGFIWCNPKYFQPSIDGIHDGVRVQWCASMYDVDAEAACFFLPIKGQVARMVDSEESKRKC